METLVEEKRELDLRIEMLHRYMMGSQYDKLSELERDQLVRQHIAMSQYSGILGERINGFTGS
jgi:hypothetical protein